VEQGGTWAIGVLAAVAAALGLGGLTTIRRITV
jgi:hypothetical protein